jgi:murein DD-endopeptidase MepM/ murein hydrolase activator NlpD
MRIRQIAPLLLLIVAPAASGCEKMKQLDARRDAKKRAEILAQQPPKPIVVDSIPIITQPSTKPASIGPQITPPQPVVLNVESPVKPTVVAPNELATLSAQLIIPVKGVLRPQLRNTYAEPRGTRVHEAIDILAPRGTEIVSAADGRLLKLFNSKAGGLMIYATDPSERFILLYGHLDKYAAGLTNGMTLKRGQLIGYVGTTGNAPPNTPHLHFGILRGDPAVSWSKGDAVNPYPLLNPK